jgi:hypothetical protein
MLRNLLRSRLSGSPVELSVCARCGSRFVVRVEDGMGVSGSLDVFRQRSELRYRLSWALTDDGKLLTSCGCEQFANTRSAGSGPSAGISSTSGKLDAAELLVIEKAKHYARREVTRLRGQLEDERNVGFFVAMLVATWLNSLDDDLSFQTDSQKAILNVISTCLSGKPQ